MGRDGEIEVFGAGQLDRAYLDVLQVGRGHLRLTVDSADPVEVERARWLIEDMLRRGFAIFVENDDGTASRVKGFDPEHMTYIVGDGPDDAEAAPADPAPAKKGRHLRQVPVATAKATAVGRTAGG